MGLTAVNFLPYIVLGLIIGWVIGILLKEKSSNILFDVILGVIGAVIGGFIIADLLGSGIPFIQLNPISFFVASIGALITVLLARIIYRMIGVRA